MKEFMEKLNEKLTHLLNNFGEHCEEWGSDKEGDCHRKACSDCVLMHAIEIANQLAEEYNNDFCEWEYNDYEEKWQTDCGVLFTLNDSDKEITNYCPCCGKEIKIINQTGEN